MLQVDWSQVLSWSSLLKRHDPRPRDGSGPKIKTNFPVLFKMSMRRLNSRFVRSLSSQDMSLCPQWTTMRFMEIGSDGIRALTLARMSTTLAPGKQCVTALKNRIPLVMESPMITVVGGKSGRGTRERGWRASKRQEFETAPDGY